MTRAYAAWWVCSWQWIAFMNNNFMNINVISRRAFLQRSLVGLGALTTIPPFARKALAEASVGLNRKKLLFIFLRGANDGLNSIIPYGDASYNSANRPNIYISQGAADYSST